MTAAFDLDPVEIRVLGSLSEKDLATPEYYPLSLHALTAACNQKTNRDPVTELEEADVLAALQRLEEKGWAESVLEPGSRVTKYRHRLLERLELRQSEQAVLTVLLLRGPQTAGELRSRSERLHAFSDLDAVLTVLRRLSERATGPLARQLERQPGMKENRWAHLLGGEAEAGAPAVAARGAGSRMEELEERIEQLERQLRAQAERLEQLEAALGRLSS